MKSGGNNFTYRKDEGEQPYKKKFDDETPDGKKCYGVYRVLK